MYVVLAIKFSSGIAPLSMGSLASKVIKKIINVEENSYLLYKNDTLHINI